MLGADRHQGPVHQDGARARRDGRARDRSIAWCTPASTAKPSTCSKRRSARGRQTMCWSPISKRRRMRASRDWILGVLARRIPSHRAWRVARARDTGWYTAIRPRRCSAHWPAVGRRAAWPTSKRACARRGGSNHFPRKSCGDWCRGCARLHFAPDAHGRGKPAGVARHGRWTPAATPCAMRSRWRWRACTARAEGGAGGYGVVSIHRSENLSRRADFDLLMEEVMRRRAHHAAQVRAASGRRARKLRSSGWLARLQRAAWA